MSLGSGVDSMEGPFSSSARSQLIPLYPFLTDASIYGVPAQLSPCWPIIFIFGYGILVVSTSISSNIKMFPILGIIFLLQDIQCSSSREYNVPHPRETTFPLQGVQCSPSKGNNFPSPGGIMFPLQGV